MRINCSIARSFWCIAILLIACEAVGFENSSVEAEWLHAVTYKYEELLVVHNVGTDRVDVTLPALYRDFSSMVYPAEQAPEITAGEISLPAHSSIILKRP